MKGILLVTASAAFTLLGILLGHFDRKFEPYAGAILGLIVGLVIGVSAGSMTEKKK